MEKCFSDSMSKRFKQLGVIEFLTAEKAIPTEIHLR